MYTLYHYCVACINGYIPKHQLSNNDDVFEWLYPHGSDKIPHLTTNNTKHLKDWAFTQHYRDKLRWQWCHWWASTSLRIQCCPRPCTKGMNFKGSTMTDFTTGKAFCIVDLLQRKVVKPQNCTSIAWHVMNHIIILQLFITSQLALTNTTLADNLHRAVKLTWIFLGAPLIFNEAPRNIQGNLTGMPPRLAN